MSFSPLGSAAPAWKIRDAAPTDLEALVRFSAAMALETEHRILDQERLRQGTRAVLESMERGFYLVAEGSSMVVGQLLITYEWSDWRNGVFWWIQSVYVEPSVRRRGVYRALHDYVLQEARRRGQVCGIRLYVEHENAAAQATYARMEMRATGYRIYERDFVL
jgi:ribosomal protein S18 acetylase RimI-like enzyme